MKSISLSMTLTAAVLLLAACGKTEAPAPAPAPVAAAPAPAPAAPAAPENTVGKSIYGKTCSMCHAAGVAGAPKPGDKADWGPRIAQGKDTLYKHAIEGFNGSKGAMPAKGGNPALNDEKLEAIIAFIRDLQRKAETTKS